MISNKVFKKYGLAMFVAGAFAAAVIIPPFFSHKSIQAESLSELRNKSAKLQAEIDANKAQAEALSHEAHTLKEAIAGLDGQIDQATKQIQLTDLKIAELEIQLKKAKEELERQKGLLKASMRALYKRGDASTVELLVGSDSFSEFIDEQEYLERLKVGIQDSAKKVIELKHQIEAQHEEQKNLKNQQEAAKKTLNETRGQRARLLEQTQGEEAKYRKVVEDLKQQQAAADAAIARALNSGSYRVSPVGPIAEGGVVGAVGNTGLSTGPHLHLEVRTASGVTNPGPYIKTDPIKMPPGYVSQRYGNPDPIYRSGYHPGIDYATSSGAPIFAIDSGYMYRGCSNQLLGTSNNAYGYVAIIEHSNGIRSVYAHMSGGPSECNYNTYY